LNPPTEVSPTRRGWQTVFLFLLGAAILALLYRLRAVFTPLLVALIIAYIANPTVTWLEKRGIARVLTIACFYVVFFGLGGLIAILGVPVLERQGAAFSHEMFAGDHPKIERVLGWAESRLKKFTGREDAWQSLRQQIPQSATTVAGSIISWATAGISGFFSVLSFLILVPVFTFILLKNMNRIWERARDAIPILYRDRVVATLVRIHRANAAFFRGQIAICLIEGTIVFVVLTALGVRFSLFFGALYALLGMIPYLGVVTVFALTTIFTLVDTGGFTSTFFMVVGMFVLIQILEVSVLQPYILGRQTGLHPIAIILSIMIFGDLFGFFGLLLAVPLASATIIVAQDYLVPMVREVTEPPKTQ
jgi:predicted PurR-regulated permease PerM